MTDTAEPTNDLTDADLAEIRAAESRGKAMLASVVLDVAIPAGRPIAPVGHGLTDPDLAEIRYPRGVEQAAYVARCRCGDPVPRRLDRCPKCLDADLCQVRSQSLLDAYDSVSPERAQHWCRVNTPDFLMSVRLGLEAADRLPEPERDVAIRILRGGYQRADGSVVILGPTDYGKTCAATACAMRILDQGVAGKLDAKAMKFAAGIRFVSGLEVANARKEHKLGSRVPMIDAAQNASLLLLDEVGYEEGGPVPVRDLIDHRYRRQRPTIVTSGNKRAEFTARYGQPVMRRLEQHGVVIDLHPGAKR